MEAHRLVAHILIGLCYWVITFLIAIWIEADTVGHTEEHLALPAPHWESGKPSPSKGFSLSKTRPLVLKAGCLFGESPEKIY